MIRRVLDWLHGRDIVDSSTKEPAWFRDALKSAEMRENMRLAHEANQRALETARRANSMNLLNAYATFNVTSSPA